MYSVVIKGSVKLHTESEREAILFLTHRLVSDSSLYQRSHILVTERETLKSYKLVPRSPLIRSTPSWM